jgi:hypothetical protein
VAESKSNSASACGSAEPALIRTCFQSGLAPTKV